MKEKVAAKIAPEQIANPDKGADQTDKETGKRVTSLRKYLAKTETEKMDFFKFILDPESFSQTVENLFHFSFLIKDGQAALTLNEDGLPVACTYKNIRFSFFFSAPAQPPHEEDYTSRKAERKQCVVKFDYDMWKV